MATPDQEALSTLLRIEKLLKQSSATAKEPASQRLSAKRLPGGGGDAQKDAADANRTLRAVAGASKKLTSATVGLTTSFGGLNTEIKRASMSIGTFTSQLSKALNALKVTESPVQETTADPLASIATVDKPTAALVDALSITTKHFGNLNSELERLVNNYAQQPAVNQSAQTTVQAPTVVATTPTPAPAPVPTPAAVPGALQKTPVLSTIGTFLRGLATSTVGLYSMTEVLQKLWQVTQTVTRDFFALSKVGLGSRENLVTLSLNAAKAGMSLSEYTKMLKDNTELAARAGSLENFDKLTSAADKQLSQLGVFGEDAKNLQATLLNTATMAGVPQQQFADVLNSQIAVFDKLRKSTNMTAQEFADLVTTVSHSEQAQKELIGLAPAERIARQNQLVELASTGRQLGLNADASKRLTDALIAQRGETVKKRFEGAGRIRQLAAVTGQSDLGEEAAQIHMKGRRASKDEQNRLREILGQIDQSSQGMYENGGFGIQNVLDNFDESLTGGLKQVMEANRPAQLATQSAEVFNKDFGKHVGEFGQTVGRMTQWLAGFGKSAVEPLGGVALGALAGLFSKSLITPLLNIVGKLVPSLGSKLLQGGAAAGGGGGMTAWLSSAGQPLLQWIKNLRSTINSLPGAALQATSNGLGSLWASMNNLGAAAKSFIGSSPFSKIPGLLSQGLMSARTGLTSLGGAVTSGLDTLLGGARSLLSGNPFTKLGSALTSGLQSVLSSVSSFMSGNPLSKLGSALSSGLQNTAAAARAFITSSPLTKIGSALTNGLQAVLGGAKSFVSSGPLTSVGQALSQGASALRGGLTTVTEAAITGLTAIGPAIKTFFKSTFLLSAIVDGVGELFTGAITAAFTSDGGGFLDRIEGAAFAALRGIPTAITGALDYIFGTNLTNKVDYVLSLAKAGFSLMTSGLVGFVVDMLDNLPFAKNSQLVKDLKAYNEKQRADIEATFATIQKLDEDGTATLASEGKKKRDMLDAQADATAKAETKAVQATTKFNSTMMADSVDAANLINDARAISSRQTVAVPGPQPTAQVNTQALVQQGQVNTGTEQQTNVPAALQQPQVTLADVVDMLNKLLSTANTSVEAEKRQVELTEQLLTNSSRSARAFVSSETTNNMLLRF